MKKTIAIIGGGPAAMFLGLFLDSDIFNVHIYEKNKTLGRKFLVAGKGGFNLSHSEELESFIARYSPSAFLAPALKTFTNHDLRGFFRKLGLPTFIGSSGRIFPEKGIKPIEVLNVIMEELRDNNVSIHPNFEWKDWNEDGDITFQNGSVIQPDLTIFSLGGGSWKVTGSDGAWTEKFEKKGIKIAPFLSANCAFEVDWPEQLIKDFSGSPLKNIAVNIGDKVQKGEVVITDFGLEGNAIYALSEEIQSDLQTKGKSQVYIDFKPMFSEEKVLHKIQKSKFKNTTDVLKKSLNISKVQMKILKVFLTKEEYLDHKILAARIKAIPITLLSAAPLDDAISTLGGVSLAELTEHYELKQMKNSYCIGEMLAWNAPTGGYLLQACFSMGVFLAKHLNSNP